VVAWLEERYRGMRAKLAVIAGLVIWIVGLGSVFSFGIWSDLRPLDALGVDKNIFGLMDFTVANVLPPVNALMIALFAGWVLSRSATDEEFSGDTPLWKTYWRWTNRVLAPLALIIVFIDLVLPRSWLAAVLELVS